MSESEKKVSGPDLAAGVEIGSLSEGQPLLGHVGDEAVVLVKQGEACFAVGATCSHYSGPLAEGIVVANTIRCPWHHARFDLASGAPVGGPGINPLPCFDVVRTGSLIRVGARRERIDQKARARSGTGGVPGSVAILGSGPAGLMVAETLRAQGYEGRVALVGEEGVPMDRPNLSKDYLAGTAPEEWLPLRDEAALRDRKIDLIEGRTREIDLPGKRLVLDGKADVPFEALVLATGAEPVRLPIPGADLPHVHVLRTLADSRAIAAATAKASKAVVIGGGFIGLEAAASLRARNLEVTVVLRGGAPLAGVLGEELGKFVEGLHSEHGVRFLRDTPTAIDATGVTLASGRKADADLVVVGVGVRPRVELAARAGIQVDDGIVVDEQLRTSAPGVWAVGDVARFPWGPDRTLIRVEHFVHAERMGFVAARNLLGHGEAFRFAPFFWSQHYDVPIAYVGTGPWDDVQIVGDAGQRDVLAVYRSRGRAVAMAAIHRDQDSLRFEDALERGDQAGIESLVDAFQRRTTTGRAHE